MSIMQSYFSNCPAPRILVGTTGYRATLQAGTGPDVPGADQAFAFNISIATAAATTTELTFSCVRVQGVIVITMAAPLAIDNLTGKAVTKARHRLGL